MFQCKRCPQCDSRWITESTTCRSCGGVLVVAPTPPAYHGKDCICIAPCISDPVQDFAATLAQPVDEVEVKAL